jgi:hypothetical protein
VASVGVAFDAEQRGAPFGWHRVDDRAEVDSIEDLREVTLSVRGRELDAGTLSDPEPGILSILELAEVGRGRELPVVAVLDAGSSKPSLEPHGIRPGVLRSPNTAPLPNVEQQPNIGLPQRLEEPVDGEAVHADGGDPAYVPSFA